MTVGYYGELSWKGAIKHILGSYSFKNNSDKLGVVIPWTIAHNMANIHDHMIYFLYVEVILKNVKNTF